MPASNGEASIIDTRVNLPKAFGVTFFHVPPLSVDTCTSPSSLPVQSTPAFTGDSAKAKMVAYHSVPVMSPVTGPPLRPIVAVSASVRSPEILSHEAP